MKKIILLIVLFFNLIPVLKEGKIEWGGAFEAFATEDYGGEDGTDDLQVGKTYSDAEMNQIRNSHNFSDYYRDGDMITGFIGSDMYQWVHGSNGWQMTAGPADGGSDSGTGETGTGETGTGETGTGGSDGDSGDGAYYGGVGWYDDLPTDWSDWDNDDWNYFNNEYNSNNTTETNGGSGLYVAFPSIFENPNNPLNVPDNLVIDNGVEISEPSIILPAANPILIGYTTDRNPPNGQTPPDMVHGLNGDMQGIFVGLYPPYLTQESDLSLFGKMLSLIADFTTLNQGLREVGGKMVQKFQQRTGGNFSDPVLNQNVNNSAGFKNFMKLFGKQINDELKNRNGNINNVSIDMNLTRPSFGGVYNKFHGLQILMNDTQKTEVYLEKFELVPGSTHWIATLNVKIYDNFGLDKHDAVEHGFYHSGFGSWYILQQRRDYIPFQTVVNIRVNLSANY